MPVGGRPQGRQSVVTAILREGRDAWLISNMESSFKGHTVDALVLTGDEGRDKLR